MLFNREVAVQPTLGPIDASVHASSATELLVPAKEAHEEQLLDVESSTVIERAA